MRCFIAIDIPDENNNVLKEMQKKIKWARCTFPKEFHITLRFFENLNDDEVKKLIDNLQRLKFHSFECSFKDLGFFPNDTRINVIWVGIDNIEIFNKLSEEITKITGFEDSRFFPHITIARVKNIENKALFKQSLQGIKVKNGKFKIDCLKLYKSILTSSGPIHEVLKTISLEI